MSAGGRTHQFQVEPLQVTVGTGHVHGEQAGNPLRVLGISDGVEVGAVVGVLGRPQIRPGLFQRIDGGTSRRRRGLTTGGLGRPAGLVWPRGAASGTTGRQRERGDENGQAASSAMSHHTQVE